MDYPEIFDRWWSDWVGLFPDLPYWNPYVAAFAVMIAIRLALWLFHRIDQRLWRQDRPPPKPPYE